MNIEEAKNILKEFINIDRKMRKPSDNSDFDKFCEEKCVAIETLL